MSRWYAMIVILVFTAMSLTLVMSDPTPRPARATPESEPPPDEIILEFRVGEPPSGPVIPKIFTHKTHSEDYNVACKVCHHVYEDGENVWEEGMPVKKCEACHKPSAMEVEERLVPGVLMKKLIIQGTCSECHKTKYG